MSKELKKVHKSDKPRTTERSGGLKDRPRNPSKESDITGEKRNKHDDKKRGVRESDKKGHSPATTKASSTKLKEKITKETSSPKLAHSPIPKKTQSPKVSHSPLPRKASELLNSPLIKKKPDKSGKPSQDVVSQSSPQRSRRDKNQGDHTPKQAHHDRVTTKLEKKAVAKLKESKEHVSSFGTVITQYNCVCWYSLMWYRWRRLLRISVSRMGTLKNIRMINLKLVGVRVPFIQHYSVHKT